VLVPAAFLALACAQPAQTDAAAQPEAIRSASGELPLKLAARPTEPAITERDLMTRIYVFADDSMLGRQAGTEGGLKGTAYIERELRRLGLQPAGDNGTFFQDVPIVLRGWDSTSTIAVEGATLRIWSDFAPLYPRGAARSLAGRQVIYGGEYGSSTLTAADVAGKIVLLAGPARFAPVGRVTATNPFFGAAAVMVASMEEAPPTTIAMLRRAGRTLSSRGPAALADAVTPMYVTRAAAEKLLGRPLAGAAPKTIGRTVSASMLGFTETPLPARNVVAVLPGSDPAFSGRYVAIGAHSDHVGVEPEAVDHDSLKAFNAAVWAMRGKNADNPSVPAAQRASIRVNMDSLRALRPARRDSINNGADDDGSGSMGMLEIAENLVKSPQRPRRSVLFVWHTAEELGLLGSRYFSEQPTVPRDSIEVQVNIDMIGRGSAADLDQGGPNYLGLLGQSKLSAELGRIVEETNRAQQVPLDFDARLDAPGHPEQIYCRSDHWNYARYGIPIVFFFTSLHGDYHQVTDEPQYLDYPHFLRITNYVRDLTVRLANLDHHLVVEQARPAEPLSVCRQ
jgi:hypothetical protein